MTLLEVQKEVGRTVASIPKANNHVGHSLETSPCKGCTAMFQDTAAADVFDRIQEQSRATFRAKCTLVADSAKPCMQAAPKPKPEPPPNPRSLVIKAQDAADELRDLLQANTALEWLVANAPTHGMPKPEELGALLSLMNEGVATRLAALESALSALRVEA